MLKIRVVLLKIRVGVVLTSRAADFPVRSFTICDRLCRVRVIVPLGWGFGFGFGLVMVRVSGRLCSGVRVRVPRYWVRVGVVLEQGQGGSCIWIGSGLELYLGLNPGES